MINIDPYYKSDRCELLQNDCRDVLPLMPNGVFSAVITDPPYGITQNDWDDTTAVRLADYRQLSPRCVVFSFQPFASRLIIDNLDWFKYEIIWHKTQAVGHLNANRQPLREHENILIFGNGIYNPQMTKKDKIDVRPFCGRALTDNYGEFDPSAPRTIARDVSFPRTVIKFANVNHGERGLHPTQKPVELLRYLINTYTNPGDLILDPSMGSGTTLVAAIQTGRRGIGIEINPEYCAIAEKRIRQAESQLLLGI